MMGEQLDLEDFLRRGQAAQAEVNRIIQRSDQVARTRPRARGTDPQTSHKAAKRASNELTRKQQAVLDCFMWKARPMSDPAFIRSYNLSREMHNWPPQSDSGLRTRRHELVVKEKLQKVGVEDRGKGKPFTLWGVVP